MATKKTEAIAGAPPTMTFRDKRFASRTVFTDDMRALEVRRGRIEVKTDDSAVRSFLESHPDFEQLE